MQSRDLALEFIDRFCSGNIETLAEILAVDLEFEGPLLQVKSREDYLEALRTHSLEQCTYQILDCVQEVEKIVVFYEYQKQQESIKVAQSFEIKNGFIAKTLLIFDRSQLD